MRADKDVGISLHIEHTPTIWVVSNKKGGKPYVEVTDTSQLYAMIDAMKKESECRSQKSDCRSKSLRKCEGF